MRLFEFENNKGSYAAVKFDPITIKALEAYQIDNNIPNPLVSDEFHSTVMFSRKYIPEFKSLGDGLDWDGDFTEWDIFPSDDDNALVLKFECSELTDRFNQIVNDYGATWDHDDFQPHITLSYNVDDLNIDDLPPFKGHITIVSEYNEDLELEWAGDKK